MPGLAGFVFHLTKYTYGVGQIPHHPCERNERAGIYAQQFSRILRTALEKLPSFTISGFKGSLIPREIAPRIWTTGVTIEFRAVKDLGIDLLGKPSGINDHFALYEHQLMTEIYKAIDNSAVFKKLFENGDVQDIFFGIEPIIEVNSNKMVGLSVHFVGEGHIFSTDDGGIPMSRFAE